MLVTMPNFFEIKELSIQNKYAYSTIFILNPKSRHLLNRTPEPLQTLP